MLDLYKTNRKRAPVKVRGDRQICDLETTEGLREYKGRTTDMAMRQDGFCALCQWAFTPDNPPTFDHQLGRGSGGAWRDDRILIDGKWNNAALHEYCNVLKGSRKYHWIKEGDQMKYIPTSTGDEA